MRLSRWGGERGGGYGTERYGKRYGEKIREAGVRREEEAREKRKMSYTRTFKFFKDNNPTCNS